MQHLTLLIRRTPGPTTADALPVSVVAVGGRAGRSPQREWLPPRPGLHLPPRSPAQHILRATITASLDRQGRHTVMPHYLPVTAWQEVMSVVPQSEPPAGRSAAPGRELLRSPDYHTCTALVLLKRNTHRVQTFLS